MRLLSECLSFLPQVSQKAPDACYRTLIGPFPLAVEALAGMGGSCWSQRVPLPHENPLFSAFHLCLSSQRVAQKPFRPFGLTSQPIET